jgi:hypothetical protein
MSLSVNWLGATLLPSIDSDSFSGISFALAICSLVNGVVGVVKRYDRRLVAVVNKAKTSKQRAAIITELFDYGFNEYKKVTLFSRQ